MTRTLTTGGSVTEEAMATSISLSGTALLTSGVIDLQDIASVVATIVKAGHTFKMSPTRVEDEDWRVTVRIDLQGEESLALLQELRRSGRFDHY